MTGEFFRATPADYNVQDIHDILRSYYDRARKRFVDNIYKQVVDHKLVKGDSSPLRLFNSAFVTRLTEQELEDIAGEEEGTKNKRRELLKGIEDLETGRAVLH